MKDFLIKGLFSLGLTLIICGLVLTPSGNLWADDGDPTASCPVGCSRCGNPVPENGTIVCKNVDGTAGTCAPAGVSGCSACSPCEPEVGTLPPNDVTCPCKTRVIVGP